MTEKSPASYKLRMMNPKMVGIALALSVGLNLYQWQAEPSSSDGGAEASGAKVAEGQSVAGKPVAGDSRGTIAASASGVEPASQLALEECRSDLESTTAERDELLPFDAKFERGEHNAKATAHYGEMLKEFFAGIEVVYDFECRASVCQLEMITSKSKPGRELHELQGGALGPRTRGQSFTMGNPGVDPVSKEGIRSHFMYFGFYDESYADGMSLVNEALAPTKDDIVACSAKFPDDAGTLKVKVSLREGADAIEVLAGGDVASSDVGRCATEALRARVSDAMIPEKVTGAVRVFNLSFPYKG